MSSKISSRFSSPVTKLAQFFERSRDLWKAKAKRLRKETKRLKNQIYALGKSRNAWKQRARTSEARLEQLEHEIAALKNRRRSPRPAAAERPRAGAAATSG